MHHGRQSFTFPKFTQATASITSSCLCPPPKVSPLAGFSQLQNSISNCHPTFLPGYLGSSPSVCDLSERRPRPDAQNRVQGCSRLPSLLSTTADRSPGLVSWTHHRGQQEISPSNHTGGLCGPLENPHTFPPLGLQLCCSLHEEGALLSCRTQRYSPVLRETLPELQTEAGSSPKPLCFSFIALIEVCKNICDYLINIPN